MRLQAYLIHEGRTKKLDAKTAIPWMKKQCKIHIKKLLSQTRPVIYRGIGGFNGKYGIVDPSTSDERRSANTSNHTTLLMDNLPKWKKYPKRSQSLICSTDHLNASSYGELYYVYPTDKCDIGIVPTTDVWDAFQTMWGQDIPTFNRKMKSHNIPDDSWAKMKSELIKFYEIVVPSQFNDQKNAEIKKIPGNEWNKNDSAVLINGLAGILSSGGGGVRNNRMIYDYLYNSLGVINDGKKPLSVIDWFDMYMNPQKNGFKLNKLSSKDKRNEVWIGNAPIFVVKVDEKQTLEQEELM